MVGFVAASSAVVARFSVDPLPVPLVDSIVRPISVASIDLVVGLAAAPIGTVVDSLAALDGTSVPPSSTLPLGGQIALRNIGPVVASSAVLVDILVVLADAILALSVGSLGVELSGSVVDLFAGLVDSFVDLVDLFEGLVDSFVGPVDSFAALVDILALLTSTASIDYIVKPLSVASIGPSVGPPVASNDPTVAAPAVVPDVVPAAPAAPAAVACSAIAAAVVSPMLPIEPTDQLADF